MAMNARLSDHVITLLYEGVLTPASWTTALSLLCKLMGCEQAALTTWDRRTDLAGVHESVGLPIACRQQFLEHYCALDPARDVMDLIPTGTWYIDHQIVGEAVMGRSAFYQEFLRGFGLASIVASPLLRDKLVECFLVFQYGPRQPLHRQCDPSLLNSVLPHMQRAIRLRRHFAEIEDDDKLNQAIFGALRLPVLVVDRDGHIISATAAAESALARSSHLKVDHGRLSLVGSRGSELQQLFRVACGGRLSGGGILGPDPGDGRSAMQILVTPLPPLAACRFSSTRPLAIVLLHDPDEMQPSHASLCQQLYSLTPAEAQVAIGITRGMTPKELAKQADVSLATVRSQLSAALQKTGSSRQVDLIRKLCALLLLR